MPVRVVRIVDGVDAFRIRRIFNIEQDSVARARAGGQAKLRVDRNVVALVGVRRLFRSSLPCVPPLLSALMTPRAGIHKESRTRDDLCILRRG